MLGDDDDDEFEELREEEEVMQEGEQICFPPLENLTPGTVQKYANAFYNGSSLSKTPTSVPVTVLIKKIGSKNSFLQ